MSLGAAIGAIVGRNLAFTVPLYAYLSVPAFAQTIILQRMTIGEIAAVESGRRVGQSVREFGTSYLRAREALPGYNRDFQEARARFWREFPSGPGFVAADQALAKKLWAKDVYYLSWLLPLGAQNAMGPGDLRDLIEPLRRSIGDLDGGIRPSAYIAFTDWVAALRTALGARDGEPAVGLLNPALMAQALVTTRNRLEAYVRARDWAEFEASGLDLSKYMSPKSYALRLIEKRLSGTRLNPAFERPDPEAEAAKIYSFIEEGAGAQRVLAAAATVLAAKKDLRGNLVTPVDIQLPNNSKETVQEPERWFEALVLTSDARGYAFGLARKYAGFLLDWRVYWEKGIVAHRKIIAEYGEKAVLAAAEKERLAPKDAAGMPIGVNFAKILSPNETFITFRKPPEPPVPTFEATDVASLKPRAFGMVNGKLQMGNREGTRVRGVVSRITWESTSGPLPQRYRALHFAGVPGDAVIVRLDRVADLFESRYGGEAGLLNSTIEVTYRPNDGPSLDEAGKIVFMAIWDNFVVVAPPSGAQPAPAPASVVQPAAPPPNPTSQTPSLTPRPALSPSVRSAPEVPFLPRGTAVTVITDGPLTAQNASSDSTIPARLFNNITFGSRIVLPKGTEVLLKTFSQRTASNQAPLQISVQSILVNGRQMPVATTSIPINVGNDASARPAVNVRRAPRPAQFRFLLVADVNE